MIGRVTTAARYAIRDQKNKFYNSHQWEGWADETLMRAVYKLVWEYSRKAKQRKPKCK